MRMPKKNQNEQNTTKKEIKKLLNQHGWFWWSAAASPFSVSGIADIHAVKTGMYLAVEAKFGKNDPTPLQRAFLDSVRAQDHMAFVVRDTTVVHFAAFLEYLDKSIAIAAKNQVPGADIGGPLADAAKALIDTEVLNPSEYARAAAKAGRRSKTNALSVSDEAGD